MKAPITKILLALILTGLVSAIPPAKKVAVAEVGVLLENYHETVAVVEKLRGMEEVLVGERDKRVATLKTLAEDAERLQKGMDDPTLAGEKKKELLDQFRSTQQNRQRRGQEMETWLRQKQQALVEQRQILLQDVRKNLLARIGEFGQENGYDFIFDKQTTGISGVNVLLYTKDAADITTELLAFINEGAPPAANSEE